MSKTRRRVGVMAVRRSIGVLVVRRIVGVLVVRSKFGMDSRGKYHPSLTQGGNWGFYCCNTRRSPKYGTLRICCDNLFATLPDDSRIRQTPGIAIGFPLFHNTRGSTSSSK